MGIDLVAWTQVLVGGLGNGAVYALVGLGFSLIFRSTGAINFAQGEWVMLAGMTAAAAFLVGVPLPVAAVLALATAVAAGVLSYLLAVDRLADRTPLLVTMVSIGIALFTKGLVMVTLGKNPAGFPGVFGNDVLVVGAVAIPLQTLVVVAACALFVLALHVFFTRSRLGLALRATSSDADAAALVGIPVQRMVMVAFGLAAAAGAIAGLVITPLTLINYDGGTMLGFKGFSAAMLGGMGHPFGAVVGGAILGLLEAFAAFQISSQFKDAAAFVVLLLVLFLKPSGLFGRERRERL